MRGHILAAIVSIGALASTSTVAQAQEQGGTVVVQFPVRDYDTWRPAFDRLESDRRAAGVSRTRIYRSADNPNDILLIMDVVDLAKHREFMASDQLKTEMRNSGVVGQPEIHTVK